MDGVDAGHHPPRSSSRGGRRAEAGRRALHVLIVRIRRFRRRRRVVHRIRMLRLERRSTGHGRRRLGLQMIRVRLGSDLVLLEQPIDRLHSRRARRCRRTRVAVAPGRGRARHGRDHPAQPWHQRCRASRGASSACRLAGHGPHGSLSSTRQGSERACTARCVDDISQSDALQEAAVH